MCGLAGAFTKNENISSENIDKVKKMISYLSHRGPDHEDFFENQKISLGFTRLSIIDIEHGNQPFESADKRFTIVFNGEIYNYLEIKKNLKEKNYNFRTNSDTELLLESWAIWGQECLKFLNGMFAFAIYDKLEKKLFLGRDRLGMKPLFYVLKKDTLFFSSETQALLRCNIINTSNIDFNSINDYLSFRQPLTSNVFFKDALCVDPGQIITIDKDLKIVKNYYWSLPHLNNKIENNENFYVDIVSEQLDRAVKEHLTSDVELGVLLSGGLDSSLIAGVSRKYLNGKFKTFSASYNYPGYDESKDAQLVSNTLNTSHTNLEINYEDYIEENINLVSKTLNPLMMPHEIPLNKLFKEIQSKVKVVLSGEGADEFFGGYSRDQGLDHDLRKLSFLEKNNLSKNSLLLKILDLKKYKDLNIINQKNILRLNYCWFSKTDKYEIFSKDFSKQMNDDSFTEKYFDNFFLETKEVNDNEKFLFFFQKLHLKALLSRLDYLSMNNSVEARCPFLDHKLIETISKVPFYYKLRWKSFYHKVIGYFNSSKNNSDTNLVSKYILRSIAKNKIPNQIVTKKKLGFPTPLDLWFSKNLKNKAKDIILDKAFLSRNIFNQEKLLMLIENKKNYPYDFWGKQIWLLMNLSIWFNSIDKKNIL